MSRAEYRLATDTELCEVLLWTCGKSRPGEVVLEMGAGQFVLPAAAVRTMVDVLATAAGHSVSLRVRHTVTDEPAAFDMTATVEGAVQLTVRGLDGQRNAACRETRSVRWSQLADALRACLRDIVAQPMSGARPPRMFCDTIEEILRVVNDFVSQADRDALGGWVLANFDRLLATGHDGQRTMRAYVVLDYAFRTMLPMWLELAGAGRAAGELRGLPAIVDGVTARVGFVAVFDAREGLGAGSDMLAVREKVAVVVAGRLDGRPAEEALDAVDLAVEVACESVDLVDAARYVLSGVTEPRRYAAGALGEYAGETACDAVGFYAVELAVAAAGAGADAAVAAVGSSSVRTSFEEAVVERGSPCVTAELNGKRAAAGAGSAVEATIDLLERLLRAGENWLDGGRAEADGDLAAQAALRRE